jgi:AcrR family transcriptional regulator
MYIEDTVLSYPRSVQMSTVVSAGLRPGPRPGTSRQQIVQCAIRMLDREGPETLTFRAVARELGITVGALSRYFKNLADLEDEVAARLMAEIRPFDAASKRGPREQLLRFAVEFMELNQARPYLLKIHGPSSAAVIARHTRQYMEVMRKAGIDFERGMAVFSMVGSLAYAWGIQQVQPQSPEAQASIAQSFAEELGEFLDPMEKLFSLGTSAMVNRRWLALLIDTLLADSPSTAKRR